MKRLPIVADRIVRLAHQKAAPTQISMLVPSSAMMAMIMTKARVLFKMQVLRLLSQGMAGKQPPLIIPSLLVQCLSLNLEVLNKERFMKLVLIMNRQWQLGDFCTRLRRKWRIRYVPIPCTNCR